MDFSLDKLRGAVLEAQKQSGNAVPGDPAKQIAVNREGKLLVGNQSNSDEPTTQVDPSIFAMGGANC